MLTAAFRTQSGGSSSPPHPTMQPRGRSRVVSPVALARQASEERRQSRITVLPNAGCFASAMPPSNSLLLQLDKQENDKVVINIPVLDAPPSNLDSHPIAPSKTSLARPNFSSSISPSISILPPDACDAPPSPPQSLEDQVQVAYALDDIRLAKILLLKLKGIHVTSDADPRIDQVRDEDFDMCFAPSGPLTLEEADSRAVQETQRKQRQWWHESQRAQRLRACEKIWEEEKKRLHDERLRAIRRREEEDAREEERRRLAVKQLRELTSRERQQRCPRSRVETYVVTRREADPFQYSFMPPMRTSSSTLPCCSPQAPKKKPVRSSGSHNRSVSFKEVINAMNGQLFPLDSSERADDAGRIAGLNLVGGSSCHRRKASVRAELLDSLLQVVEWQEGERRRAKGKDVERDQQTLRSTVHPPTPMPSVPTSVSVTSLSSSASPSRSSSWLSFGSWRSYATDVTTPDSPIISSPTSSKHCILPIVQEQRELHPCCSFVRISVEESPLSPPPMTPLLRHTPRDDCARCGTASSLDSELVPSVGMRLAIVQRVTRSVVTIIEAAKGLQSAYIAATIFAAGPSQDLCATSSQPHEPGSQRQARRQGYRALAEDVKKFAATATPNDETSKPVHFIPLVAPSSQSVHKPPPTPKNAIIFPSPLRPRTPPAVLAYRMRPVANPAVLRLKALQNLMCTRGKEWEGRAREGGLGCGKERLLGIAFEGRGRSGLGCEVRFIVA